MTPRTRASGISSSTTGAKPAVYACFEKSPSVRVSTIFGTFMTRSGVVQSVHAFGEDRQLAMMFTVFMSAVLVFELSGDYAIVLPLLVDAWIDRLRRHGR